MIDYADAIKQQITTRQFAESVGIPIDRHGFIVCPFHGDRDASLKLYDNGSWYCFGCNQGGDVISFAMRWYGESFKEALKRLDSDFKLGLYQDGSNSNKNGSLSAVSIAARKTLRLKQERLRRQIQANYDVAYDKWLEWQWKVEDLQPDRDGDWTPEFCRALIERNEAAERLNLAEMEIMNYGKC